MRWLFALIAVFGYIVVWRGGSPGVQWLGLGIGVIFSILAVLAFAQFRINGSARDESLTDAQMESLKKSLPRPGSGSSGGNRQSS